MKILVSVGSIKTIVRCRCVCKSWLDLLFGDPYFARLHFSRVKASAADCIVLDTTALGEHKTVRHSALLDFQDQDYGSRPSYEIRAALIKLFSLKYTDYIHQSSTTKLLGSCNGLLCFYDTAYNFLYTDIRPMFVSNPLTREYVVLPIWRPSRPFESLHGFGFSRKTNQYKVIQLYSNHSRQLYLEDESKPPTIWKAKVHTLGSGVWRSIGIVPYNFSYTELYDTYCKPGNPNTYLNGTLYWVANCSSSHPESFKFRYINRLICSFDLESEQFQSLPPLPNEICQERFHSLTLGVLGDRLCIVCDATIYGSCGSLDAAIWVLNDKSNDSSRWWDKEHVIKVEVPTARYGENYYLKLIKVLKTGEILFWYGYYSIFYNPRDESSSRVKWIRTCDMVAHTPSFVSLKDVASGNNWEVTNAPFKLQSEVEELLTVHKAHTPHKIY